MTGTGAERVPTDHLSTPPLMGNRWKGRGQDEQSVPRPPAWVLLPSPLHITSNHRRVWGAAGAAAESRAGVWKDGRDQAPALPLKRKGLGQAAQPSGGKRPDCDLPVVPSSSEVTE